jgi:hypothetical protein
MTNSARLLLRLLHYADSVQRQVDESYLKSYAAKNGRRQMEDRK